MIRSAFALTWRLLSAWPAAGLRLPPVVNEGLVRLGHAVRVVPAFDRGALLAESVNDFGGQTLGHGAPLAGPRRAQHPAHGERELARGADLQRYLVGGATHAAGPHLQRRHHVADSRLEHLDRILLGPLTGHLQRVVYDALRGALLAPLHELVDHHPHPDAPVLCVGRPWTADYLSPARHCSGSEVYWGPSLLRAPYLLRCCLRTLTPTASRAPRTMW